MLDIETATTRSKEIYCKILNLLIKLYFFCFIFHDFPFCIKNSIKSEIFVYVREMCVRNSGSYDLKQGNPLQNFKITNRTLSVVILFLILG